MSRWISCVRPPIFPFSASRGERVNVDRGNIPYSAVTHPRPEFRIHPGTPFSTVALHKTLVLPTSIKIDPSAVATNPGVSFTSRAWF
jgi:hypothetical protein